ncbi:hypothetical protein BU26DRAFT_579845 [Trematosphaeria pertusa]|uniref:Uncharacterized protein n=1 Tax=Trematosphaeria pertusa TaxID=390896 RepID=A0A6A6I201_9PLEO|nr:uncharacterized protein BU26DRAFT_579845 [Trematosphaeria pertusa]KAF2244002.1 hypothetical protein BU26DRAFT_579845 [Trematosphaeria pertusa]
MAVVSRQSSVVFSSYRCAALIHRTNECWRGPETTRRLFLSPESESKAQTKYVRAPSRYTADMAQRAWSKKKKEKKKKCRVQSAECSNARLGRKAGVPVRTPVAARSEGQINQQSAAGIVRELWNDDACNSSLQASPVPHADRESSAALRRLKPGPFTLGLLAFILAWAAPPHYHLS